MGLCDAIRADITRQARRRLHRTVESHRARRIRLRPQSSPDSVWAITNRLSPTYSRPSKVLGWLSRSPSFMKLYSRAIHYMGPFTPAAFGFTCTWALGVPAVYSIVLHATDGDGEMARRVTTRFVAPATAIFFATLVPIRHAVGHRMYSFLVAGSLVGTAAMTLVSLVAAVTSGLSRSSAGNYHDDRCRWRSGLVGGHQASLVRYSCVTLDGFTDPAFAASFATPYNRHV